MDVLVVNPFDPADRDHVVLEAAGEIQLRQFNLVAQDVIDPAHVTAVRAYDFEVFLDERNVNHVYLQQFGLSCR
jgi:hypothetical protein